MRANLSDLFVHNRHPIVVSTTDLNDREICSRARVGPEEPGSGGGGDALTVISKMIPVPHFYQINGIPFTMGAGLVHA